MSTLLIDNSTPGLRIIRINNPARKNAINSATYIGIGSALDEADRDAAVSVIALTGVGDYFSSGDDLSGDDASALPAESKEASIDRNMATIRRMIQSFVRCSKLLIAVVNGPAIGIGSTMLPHCDIVYAADTAFFYTPFSLLGICSEGGSSYTFPRLVGASKAAEMLLLNHRLTAAEALRCGFVAEVFGAAELETKLWPRIREWPQLAHGSVRATKALMFDEQALLGAIEQEMRVLRERNFSVEAAEALRKFRSRSSTKKSKL